MQNEILKNVAETFTEKPYFEIEIPIRYITWQDKVLNFLLRRRSDVRVFTFKPCLVGNMYRIAGRAMGLPVEIINPDLRVGVLPVVETHLHGIVYIIAASIQNNHLEPSEKLIRFINQNFNHEELVVCMDAAFDNLGLQSFLSSIVLARGTVSILQPETSPEDGSELIASHTDQ